MKPLIATALALVCLASNSSSAHHSLSAYVMSTYRTVDGTVKTFQWTNPHARLVLMVPTASGSSVQWEFEGGNIGRLMSGGFTKESISPGDKIKVAYSPKRGNGIGGFFLAVTM